MRDQTSAIYELQRLSSAWSCIQAVPSGKSESTGCMTPKSCFSFWILLTTLQLSAESMWYTYKRILRRTNAALYRMLLSRCVYTIATAISAIQQQQPLRSSFTNSSSPERRTVHRSVWILWIVVVVLVSNSNGECMGEWDICP